MVVHMLRPLLVPRAAGQVAILPHLRLTILANLHFVQNKFQKRFKIKENKFTTSGSPGRLDNYSLSLKFFLQENILFSSLAITGDSMQAVDVTLRVL